jgi:hypothetical protein
MPGGVFKIVKVDSNSGSVSLKKCGIDGLPAGDVIVKAADVFAKDFRPSKMEFEKLDWQPIYAKVSSEFEIAWYKNCVVSAVGFLLDDIAEPSLLVMSKPQAVYAASAYKKGQLIMSLATTRVLCKPTSSDSSIFDCTGDAPANCILELQPVNSKSTCAVPAWLVKHNSDEQISNMEIVHKQVVVKTAYAGKTEPGDEDKKRKTKKTSRTRQLLSACRAW